MRNVLALAAMALVGSAAADCPANPSLTGLSVHAECTLSPAFSPDVHYYSCEIPYSATTVDVTPLTADDAAEVEVHIMGVAQPAGQATMYVGCPPCMASPPCT